MPELTNLSFSQLVLELRPYLENAFINKIQQIDSEALKIKLHTKEGSKTLVVNSKAMWLSSYKHQASLKEGNFAKRLEKLLYNRRIESIAQHGTDRIIVISFKDYFLIFEFFHNSNIILTDRDYKIVACLRREEWADRKIAPNEKYLFPKQKGKNIIETDLNSFKESFKSGNKLLPLLINSFSVAPAIAEAVFEKLSIAKDINVSSLGDKEWKELYNELFLLYSLKQKMAVYLKGDVILPIAVSGSKLLGESLNDCLDELFSARPSYEKEKVLEKSEEVARIEASIKRQISARAELEKKAEDSKRKAELIYENYSALEELVSAIKKAMEKGYTKREIVQKLKEASSKGNKSASMFRELDLKDKKIVVEIQ